MKRLLIAMCMTLGLVVAVPTAAQAKTHTVKTDWGFISIKEVKAPKGKKCVRVPAVIDIRNPSLTPYIISVAIGDDFSNLIGYAEFNTEEIDFVKRDAGKYKQTMKVCRSEHIWSTNPSNPDNPFATRLKIAGYAPKSEYSSGWCDGTAYGSDSLSGDCVYYAPYKFR